MGFEPRIWFQSGSSGAYTLEHLEHREMNLPFCTSPDSYSCSKTIERWKEGREKGRLGGREEREKLVGSGVDLSSRICKAALWFIVFLVTIDYLVNNLLFFLVPISMLSLSDSDIQWLSDLHLVPACIIVLFALTIILHACLPQYAEFFEDRSLGDCLILNIGMSLLISGWPFLSLITY